MDRHQKSGINRTKDKISIRRLREAAESILFIDADNTLSPQLHHSIC